jgi:type II secretory pathway component PulF
VTRFVYRAAPIKPGLGGLVEGREEARDERTLRDHLRERGLIAVEVRPVGLADALRARFGSRATRIKRADRLWFFATLARLLRSKAPVERAITTMEEVAPHEAARNACAQVGDALRSGRPLDEACAQVPGLAGPRQAALLRVGHASGDLERATALIDESLRTSERIRKTVIGRLIYPAVLIVVGVACLWFLAAVVLPRFSETLESAGANLPGATRFTLASAKIVMWAGPIVMLAVVGAILWWRAGLAPPAWRRKAQEMAFRTPLVGGLVWRHQGAVAADTIATMLEGGGDLLEALEQAEDAVGEGVVARRLARARQQVREGLDPGEAFERESVFPPMNAAVIRIGARSGDLAGALRSATETALEEQQDGIDRLLTLLQPAVILALAAVVGWVVYSLIAGMLAINEIGGF